MKGEEQFPLTAADRQHAVRRRGGNGFIPVEVVLVLDPFRFFFRDDARTQNALFEEEGPYTRPRFAVFVYRLGDDVPCAGKRFLGGGDALFGVHERRRPCGRISPVLSE